MLSTIPEERAAATETSGLFQLRSRGAGRVVVAAALAFAFVLGAVAATAVRTSGVQASDLHEMYTSAHEHEYVKMDKHGDLYVHYSDDDEWPNNPDSGDRDEADGRKCKTDRDCETEWFEFVDSPYCQNWGDNPTFTCDGNAPPDVPGVTRPPPDVAGRTIKGALIRLRSDPTKCVTYKEEDGRTLDKFVLDKCQKGYREPKKLFTYVHEPTGRYVDRDATPPPTPGEFQWASDPLPGRLIYNKEHCLYAVREYITMRKCRKWSDGTLYSLENDFYYDGKTIKIYGTRDVSRHQSVCLAATSSKIGAEIHAVKCSAPDHHKLQEWEITTDG